MRSVRTPGAVCAALALTITLGCGSGKQMAKTDRQPVTDLGVGATIIMPGQSIPMSAMGGPGTGNLSSIGGASQQIDQKTATNQSGQLNTLQEAAQQATSDDSGETPLWQKALAAPFVAAAYPFMKLGEAMEGGSEKSSSRTGGSGGSSGGSSAGQPGQSAPGATSQQSGGAGAGSAQAGGVPQASASALPPTRAPSTDPAVRAETARLGALERELAMQSPGPAPQGTTLPLERGAQPTPGEPLPWQQPQAAAPAPVVAAAAAPPARPLSIAEELAALQSSIAPRPRAEDTARASRTTGPRAAATPRAALPTSDGLADRVRDRDGDGRPDLWSYHDESGQPTRELLDEDGDGSPDRTVWFEPETGSEARVEEDTNLDGRIDSWVEFSGGKVARQRRDRDYDGQLDTWSFYDGGELARQEEDTSGDGFRNRVAFYADGRLIRERQDRNGDGRVDVLTVYDDSERPLRRDEDTDGDGRIDQRSIYEAGKLIRRELVEAVINDSEEELNDTEWSSGPDEG